MLTHLSSASKDYCFVPLKSTESGKERRPASLALNNSNYRGSATFKPGELRRTDLAADENNERKRQINLEWEEEEKELVESRESRLLAATELRSAVLEERMKFPRGCSERFSRTREVVLEYRSELPKRLEAKYMAKVEKIKAGRERRESGLEWSLQARKEKNAEKYSAVRD